MSNFILYSEFVKGLFMAKDNMIVLRGQLHYAKVLGKARPHTGNPKYDKGPYWSIDLTPNAESRDLMKTFGIAEKLREPPENDKAERTESFLSLRVLENRSDGEKNRPPKVVDAQGNPWNENKLIGNGSVADVKIKVVDYGKGVQKGAYLQAIRVLEHVPYEAADFAPLPEDDEYFAAPEKPEDVPAQDLDDVPA